MSGRDLLRFLNNGPPPQTPFELLFDTLSPATRFEVAAVEDEVKYEGEGDDGADDDADLESGHGLFLVAGVELLGRVELLRVVFAGCVHLWGKSRCWVALSLRNCCIRGSSVVGVVVGNISFGVVLVEKWAQSQAKTV